MSADPNRFGVLRVSNLFCFDQGNLFGNIPQCDFLNSRLYATFLKLRKSSKNHCLYLPEHTQLPQLTKLRRQLRMFSAQRLQKQYFPLHIGKILRTGQLQQTADITTHHDALDRIAPQKFIIKME